MLALLLDAAQAQAPMWPTQIQTVQARSVEMMLFDQEFKLRNGEAVRVGNEGLALRFERVTADGRCPVGDPCISEGDAAVLATVRQPPHEPVALELHTDPNSSTSGKYLRYRVQLVRLEPRPIGEQYVPLPQYWATFMVRENQ